MNAMAHYENASFLRELAENLPQLMPQVSVEDAKVELLHHLANQELAQARYDEWVREKVSKARADTRPFLSQEQASERLLACAG